MSLLNHLLVVALLLRFEYFGVFIKALYSILCATIVRQQIISTVINDFLINSICKLHYLVFSIHGTPILWECPKLDNIAIHLLLVASKVNDFWTLILLLQGRMALGRGQHPCDLPEALYICSADVSYGLQSSKKWGRLAWIGTKGGIYARGWVLLRRWHAVDG